MEHYIIHRVVNGKKKLRPISQDYAYLADRNMSNTIIFYHTLKIFYLVYIKCSFFIL